MKNLIDEIEKLKLEKHPEESEYRFGFRDGNNCCVVSVKHILNQYNLITASKTIKLSEIIERLNYSNHIKFEVVKMNTHFLIENTNFYRQYFELQDNKISNISEEMQIDEFKWLYTLWIAGTEIVDDDLKEKV